MWGEAGRVECEGGGCRMEDAGWRMQDGGLLVIIYSIVNQNFKQIIIYFDKGISYHNNIEKRFKNYFNFQN